MLALSLVIGAILVRPTVAAYVQTRQCPESRADGLDPRSFALESFSASLKPSSTESYTSELSLVISDLVKDRAPCPEEDITCQITLTGLDSPNEVRGNLSSTSCHDTEFARRRRLHYTYDVDTPFSPTTFSMMVHLYGTNNTHLACIDTNVTPDIGSSISTLATLIPILSFLVVVVAAICSSLVRKPEQQMQIGPLFKEPSRTHVTRIADCLSYLQFIFFSATLSLSFPGFLQPVASHTSWSTAMMPVGVVYQQRWYGGVRDGIYEVNGTFGGTPGIELMTQFMGGTVTTKTWVNTIAFAALCLIAITFATVGRRLAWSRNWLRTNSSTILRATQSHPVVDIVWTVLRCFCSYLLLPLVAWSTYVFSRVLYFPVSFSVTSVCLVCTLVGSIAWALYRNPRNAGYLIVQGHEKHQTLVTLTRTQSVYTVVVFILLILRGIAIGGLQSMGVVQLLILIGIEIIQLSLNAMIYRTAAFSSSGITTFCKIVVLALSFGFLPSVAGVQIRMALGYAILLIHLLVLVGALAGSALYDIGRLILTPYVSSERQSRDSSHGTAG
ncbi:hypothetical protein NM208_g7752 [Fusarium decemcellulare]|uniref:Uncharacterized protein n=1 Tax=Fusarium decemcellulare TaxID=57161 RepID=A0ACC1S8F7_9HYPO|nr:hypothetical protein NM208_g7752 [Fusarium decemcellulare]